VADRGRPDKTTGIPTLEFSRPIQGKRVHALQYAVTHGFEQAVIVGCNRFGRETSELQFTARFLFHAVTPFFEQVVTDSACVPNGLDFPGGRCLNACHNPVLIHVLNSLKDLMLNSVQASVANLSHRDAFKQQIDKHHRQIYHSVISRQAKWAQKAAMAHVAHVAEALRAIETQENGLIRSSITPSANSDIPG